MKKKNPNCIFNGETLIFVLAIITCKRRKSQEKLSRKAQSLHAKQERQTRWNIENGEKKEAKNGQKMREKKTNS